MQPSNETIRDRVRHVHERFPGLDIFWDAGDAHHNSDDNQRGDWLTYLAGETPQTPFYFLSLRGAWGSNGDKKTKLRLDNNNLGGIYFKVDDDTLMA